MTPIIIGLVGPMCSGKGEVGRYLKTIGFTYQSLSDRVREETLKRGLTLTRENLQNVGNDLRCTHGGHVLAERTLSLLSGEEELLVIDGIRNPSEVDYLKQVCDISIVAIDADRELRLSWYLERARVRGEDGATADDFYRADARDSGIGEISSGQQVSTCLALADHHLTNSGSREKLFADVEALLVRRLKFEKELNGHHPEK